MSQAPFDTGLLQEILNKYSSSAPTGGPLLPGTFVGISTSAINSSPLVLAAGFRDVEKQQERGRVDKETRIAIASCTKLLIALAVLALIDEGRVEGLSIDAHVDRWVPELARGNVKVLNGYDSNAKPKLDVIEEGRDITIGMLLSHTSGSAYWFRDLDLDKYIREEGIPPALEMKEEMVTAVPLSRQPGTVWTYGLGLDWAGILVSRLTGLSLGEYLRERFLVPLQMGSTSFHPSDLCDDPYVERIDESSNGMRFHWRDPESSAQGDAGPLSVLRSQHPVPPSSTRNPIQFESGGGGLWSTAADYSKLLSYVLRLGKVAYGKPVVPDTKCPLFKPEVAQLLFRATVDVAGIEALLEGENMLDPIAGYADFSHTYGAAHFGAVTPAPLGPARSAGAKATHSGVSKGTIFWCGITQCFYIVDPIKDVAIFCATQLLPFGDRHFRSLMLEVHKAVYAQIDNSSTVRLRHSANTLLSGTTALFSTISMRCVE